MNLDDAKDMLRLYHKRAKNALALTDKQQAAVLSVLSRAYQDSDEVTISDVKKIVHEVVQQAPAALEGNEMPATQKKNEFAAQTQEQQMAILAEYFATKAPKFLASPFALDAQGKILGVGNKKALDLLIKAIENWEIHFPGNPPMTLWRVVELVAKIDLAGEWPRVIVLPPHVDENPPAPVKLDDNAINNQRLERERQMNSQGDSPIRGARTTEKVVATREELEKAAANDTAEAAAAATITAMIKNHKGRSHGASAAEGKSWRSYSNSHALTGRVFKRPRTSSLPRKLR